MYIRDAVHGSIEMSELEERIMDTPQFQRLRFVRQLSTAYLVYPSASHSRFEHSLGTMHLASQVAKRLDLDDEEVALLRLAGLLHDIGHSAFSHTGDDVMVSHGRPHHEQRGIDLVEKGGIGEMVDEAGFSVRELVARLEGKGTGALITANLGTDRLDYLLRDAHHTGVGYSLVDRDRLLETLVLQDGKVRVHEKGIVAAEGLLVSRHFMFTTVYNHPVSLITQCMVAKALDRSIEDKDITLEDLETGADLDLLVKMSLAGNDIARRLLERDLYKKAVFLRVHEASAKVRTFLRSKDVQAKLTKHLVKAGFDHDSFVIVPPPEGKSVREVEVAMRDGSVQPLENLSNILRALEQESVQKALVVACEGELVPQVGAAVRGYLKDIG